MPDRSTAPELALNAYMTTPGPTIPACLAQIEAGEDVVVLTLDEMTARHLAVALSMFDGGRLAPRVRVVRDRLDHLLVGSAVSHRHRGEGNQR